MRITALFYYVVLPLLGLLAVGLLGFWLWQRRQKYRRAVNRIRLSIPDWSDQQAKQALKEVMCREGMTLDQACAFFANMGRSKST